MSDAKADCFRVPRIPRGLRLLEGWALLAALPLLASCDDHRHRDGCFHCAPFQPYEVTYGLVAGDFNGNGHPSVISTSTVVYQTRLNAGTLEAYLSTGPGTFAAPTMTADGNNPLYLASGDLNGDSLPDVISASVDDGTLTVFLNNAQSPGAFTPAVLVSPGASQAAIGDINGDGLPDLVSADYGVTLFVQESPGTFGTGTGLYPGGANWVAIGDLNGDGAADIALTDANGVVVLMHSGAATSSTFAAPVAVFDASVSGENLIEIADVNGDGLGDLVITDPDAADGQPSVYILLQDAAHHGQFLTPVRYATGSNGFPRAISVADLNADGHPDIVIGSRSDVSVLLQNAATPGTFGDAIDYPASDVNQIAAADVNGDGLIDLIVPTGASHATVSGVETHTPGILLQVVGSPGKFSSVADLP